MNPEMNPIDPALERAVSEIRDEHIDPALVEAAGARVWARLAEQAGVNDGEHIRGCTDFQALFAEYRAGNLSESRALLVKDHLHQCVDCRRVYEGKVAVFPGLRPAQTGSRRRLSAYQWAAAAVVFAVAGASLWYATQRSAAGPVRASVQTVTGSLFEISGAGVHPLAVGQDLRDGVEIRTAKDSYATLLLRDGSTVEMRERSSFSTSQSGTDFTIHLGRGSVIIQAAKRDAGHLYVATADCRVAVTGTVFSVDAGVKGSRVSVIEGEVRVAQGNRENILHPGDQSVTGANLEPSPIAYEISWSRNGERVARFAPKPDAQEDSALLERAPASTTFFATIPDFKAALDGLRRMAGQNPRMGAWLSGRGSGVDQYLEKLQGAGEYLEEIAVLGFSDSQSGLRGPVFLARVKQEGFVEYLQKTGLPVSVEQRQGFTVFGARREDVTALATLSGGPSGAFRGSPCYARLTEARRSGGAFALCADLAQFGQETKAARYLLAEERTAKGQIESRATIGFDGPRTGIASWLAPPAAMGSLDYVSPEATFLMAFVVKDPAAIVDESLGLYQRSREEAEKALAAAQQQTGINIRTDLAAALGGEFALALDGPLLPTPSWKIVAEVYDPVKFQATVEKSIEAYNRARLKAKPGSKPLRTAQETVDGRVFYMVGAADPNPLLEAQYTFADGYLIAGPSRALLNQAIQTRSARSSIARSAKFMAMMPRDHYANFSAVMYQNLGTSLSPLISLFGALAPQQAGQAGNSLQKLGDLRSTFIALYGEPDRITIAGSGNLMGMNLSNLAGGSLLGMASSAMPLGAFPGTTRRQPAFR